MISRFIICIGIRGEKKDVELMCDSGAKTIKIKLENTYKTYEGSDFYKCFGLLRKDNPEVTFFCKGSKLNVHTSSMSSQMSLGLKAYELSLGKEATLDDIVFIFDYEDENLTNDPELQRSFYLEWIKS
ncbi:MULTISPECIES: hypothetical protein [Pseudomonas]|uniref:hypothetical protein n=1 Tax=Pseudomonas TaxID=286 RepID=UPI001F41CE6C|nr:hypothetical protein [Pseudomonas sputi]